MWLTNGGPYCCAGTGSSWRLSAHLASRLVQGRDSPFSGDKSVGVCRVTGSKDPKVLLSPCPVGPALLLFRSQLSILARPGPCYGDITRCCVCCGKQREHNCLGPCGKLLLLASMGGTHGCVCETKCRKLNTWLGEFIALGILWVSNHIVPSCRCYERPS